MSRNEEFASGQGEDDYEDDTYKTDWKEHYPKLGDVHRGVAVALPSDVHKLVHDPSVPMESRAKALMAHFETGRNAGTHWTVTPSQAEHYASVSAAQSNGSYSDEGNYTKVLLQARKPARKHIETDPDTLRDSGVIGMDYHEDAEVPMQHNAPMHLRSVAWAAPNSQHFTRHALRGTEVRA